MRLKISHVTRYEFTEPVAYALQELRLTPKSRAGQRILDWRIELDGGSKQAEFEDQHNNLVTLSSINAGGRAISIKCQGEVETGNGTGIVGEHGGHAPLWYFKRTTPLTRAGPLMRKLVRDVGANGAADLSRLHQLSAMIAQIVRYDTGRTGSETTAEQSLESGAGVCQDHAQIFLGAARMMGFPARYVSGYLLLDASVEQEAAHAWAEAHVQDIGWVGFDISNGISPDERYVRVATGLDYSQAAPVSGMRFGESAESMVVTLAVQQ